MSTKQIVSGSLLDFVADVMEAAKEGYTVKDLTDFAPRVVGHTYYTTLFPADTSTPSLDLSAEDIDKMTKPVTEKK
jgi:hypothetical protein